MSLKIVQFSTAAGDAHTNTTTEGSLARKQFAVGELLPGKVYEFECVLRATDNNSTDTLTIAVRFGTSSTVTSNTAIATSTAIDTADNDISVVRGRIYVQSATRYVFSVYMPDPDAEGIGVEAYHSIFTAAADTAYYLDVTADWSVAHADNDVQAEVFAVFEMT